MEPPAKCLGMLTHCLQGLIIWNWTVSKELACTSMLHSDQLVSLGLSNLHLAKHIESDLS